MEIIEYYSSNNKEYWLSKINECDWVAGKFLYELIKQDKLKELVGDDVKVLLLTNELDLISNGEIDHIEMISTFYNAFVPLVNFANSKMTKVQPTLLEDKCPNCGSPLVERTGKFGKFIACNNYPKCKYIKKEEKEVKYHDNLKCELCGGNLVERTATKGKNKGKKFYSCQNYPKCTFILNEKAE